MKSFVIRIALALLTFSGAVLGAANDPLVDGNNAFAFALYRQLRENDVNLFFSPYSISTALAMAYGGARGETATQMAKALHFGLPQEKLHPAFFTLQFNLDAVQKKGNIELTVANSLWPQKGFAFLPDYIDLCRTHYRTTVTPLDYAGATEDARKTINDWVEDKTHKKITDLIKPGVLTTLTRLVLANAIYFKGDWAARFDKKFTKTEPFHVSSSRTVQAPLMRKTAVFLYGEHNGLQLLELPYAGHDLSMIVLLPRKSDGLGEVEHELTPRNLSAWTKALGKGKVDVFLPKFTTSSEFSLVESLEALGMSDAFNDKKADFSGMNGRKQDLYISAVFHKAFVKVNEEGTEAAASTAVGVSTKSAARELAVVFRADHPFLFLIRDNHGGSILFLGRVNDPTR